MMKHQEFGDHYAASQLRRRNSGFRARIRQFYLDRILRHARGVTVDIGCGAGQLLEQLPTGSIGLEVNPALVRDLRAKGLNVIAVTSETTAVSLGGLRHGVAQTVVLSHVLEHFDDAATVLRRLIADCSAIGISRLIVVVPGEVGYRSDPTHKTFVALGYLREHNLLDGDGFSASHHSYFPVNLRFMGQLFIYHELMVVYDLTPVSGTALPNRIVPSDLMQFGRFVVVGVVNTAFSYAIYALLLYFGLNYAFANLTALVIGILFSFKTQGALVFANSENRRIFRYVLVWTFLYAFNIFVISQCIQLGFNSYVSGALAIPFTTLLSYVAQKRFVFRPSRARPSE
jgi:putative flippase GtrA